jgi:hypothetical protein
MKIRFFLYYLSITLSISGLILCPYAIFNTMVSLKYETENQNDCISLVNGQNLCYTIKFFQITFIFSLILLFVLLNFRKKILELKIKKDN